MADYTFDTAEDLNATENNTLPDTSEDTSSDESLVYSPDDSDFADEDTEEERKKKKKKAQVAVKKVPVATKESTPKYRLPQDYATPKNVGEYENLYNEKGNMPVTKGGRKIKVVPALQNITITRGATPTAEIQDEDGEVTPKKVEDQINTANVYHADKFPLKLKDDFFIKKQDSWWSAISPLKDEDNVLESLKAHLKTSKDADDFDIDIPFAPGVNKVHVYSKVTGAAMDFSWDAASLAKTLGTKDSPVNSLNKFLYDNGRYNTDKKKQEAYKASGLSESDALATADHTSNFWGAAWEKTKGFVNRVFQNDVGAEENFAKANELLDEKNKYKPLFAPDAPKDEKIAAVRKVAAQVQEGANELLDKELFKGKTFEEFGLLDLVNDQNVAQKFYDDLVEKNKLFVFNSGFDKTQVKKMFANRIKTLADTANAQNSFQNAQQNSHLSDDEQAAYFKTEYQKTASPDQKKIIEVADQVKGYDMAMTALRMDKGYNPNDPKFTNKLFSLQSQRDKANKEYIGLAAAQSKDNHYFFNITANKIAVVPTDKVDLNNNTGADLTPKVNLYDATYKGLPEYRLRKKYIEVNRDLAASKVEGNKKHTVLVTGVLPSYGAQDEFETKVYTIADYWKSKGYNPVHTKEGWVLSNIPAKELVGIIDQRKMGNSSWFGEAIGAIKEGMGTNDIYTYNKSTGKKEQKIDGNLMDWKLRHTDLTANSISINNRYLLNRSISSEKVNPYIAPVQQAAESFVKALDVNPDFKTSREVIEGEKEIASNLNLKLTEKSKENLKEGTVETVASATGAMLPVVGKIALAAAATEGVGGFVLGAEFVEAFAALKEGSAMEQALYHVGMAAKEELVMREAGLGPTSGLAFYGMGKLLPASARFLPEYGYRGVNNLTTFGYNALKGAASMEVASGTENLYHSINSNEKFQNYLNTAYSDYSTVAKRVIGNAFSFGIMETPQLATPHFFKSGAQLEKTLNECNVKKIEAEQAIYDFKTNPENKKGTPEYKKQLNELNKAQEKAQTAQASVQDVYNKYRYNKALETPEGLTDYISEKTKDFSDKYKEKYGDDIKIVVTDSGLPGQWTPPKFDDKGEIIEPATMGFNKNFVTKNGFIDNGLIAHEYSHFTDWMHIEGKKKEYAQKDIEVTKPDGTVIKEKPSKQQVEEYGKNLEANQNKRIVDILEKHFPELMSSKQYSTDLTGDEHVNLRDVITLHYGKYDKNGKLTNAAEIHDEIIKRVIQELGGPGRLKNPIKARNAFAEAAKDFSKIIGKNKELDYKVQNADQLLNYLHDYAQSFHKGSKDSYAHSERLAKLDLSAFGDLEAQVLDAENPQHVAAYNASQAAKQEAIKDFEIADNLPKTKESKDLEKKLEDLEDQYYDGGMDWDEYEDKRKQIESAIKASTKVAVEEVKTKEKENITKSLKVDETKLGSDIDKMVGEKDASGKYVMTKEEWDNGGLLNAKEKLIDGPMLEPLIKKELARHGVVAENVHGVPLEVFMEDVKDRLLEAALLKFNPEVNNSLGGYIIGSQFGLKNKIGDVVNRYKRQLNTSSIDTEAGGVGSVKELMATEEADSEALNNEETYQPKFKSLVKSKIVSTDALNSIKGKVTRTTRTLKSKVGEKTSINQSVEPLTREILAEMGSQADIDLKKEMGGKKDNELVNWLNSNKKAVLENATTTWLMGKANDNGVSGGIPEAVQKRVDGVWLSYPDYIGKKVDRMAVSTENRGNTSGDLMVRRTPDVANAVSNQAFRDRIIDKNGNPHRGAKESLAKEMAGQISLEIFRDDILDGMKKYHEKIDLEDISPNKRTPAENKRIEELDKAIETENPVFNAFKSNQENLGVVMAQVTEGEIIRNFEQGNKKQSENLDKAVNASIEQTEDRLKLAAESFINKDERIKKQTEILEEYYKEYAAPTKHIKVYQNKEKGGVSTLTNNDYWVNIFNPILENNYVEQAVKDKWSLSEKDINKTITNDSGVKEQKKIKEYSILYNGITAPRFLDPKTIKMSMPKYSDPNYLENNTQEGNKKTNNRINEEALDALESQIKFLNYCKELEKAKKGAGIAYYKPLSILQKQGQSSVARKLAFAGIYIDSEGVNLKPGEKKQRWLEHDPPVKEQNQKKEAYITDDSMTEADLRAELMKSKQHVIPKTLDNVLPLYTIPGEIRYNTPEFVIKLKEDYVNNKDITVTGLESVYGSIENFNEIYDQAKDAQKGIDKKDEFVEGTKASRDLRSKADALAKSLTDEYREDKRKIRVFDFDDTLGKTVNKVIYTMPDGSTGELKGHEFAAKAGDLANDGAVFDFSDFANVTEGKPGPLLSVAKIMSQKRGTKDIFVLTARPPEAAGPIQEFLSTFGLDIPLENITGLGNSTAKAKADWMVNKVNEGYNDFYFADDHLPNVTAVKEALELFDVKSRTQQAKSKFSKDLSKEINKIIFENEKVETYKVFSDITAKRRGAKKNLFDVYVPPSAADFELLLYNFMGKGTKGEEQKEFFTEALLKPYAMGNDLMDAARQSIKKEYKKLTNAFPEVSKELSSLTPDKDFTYDQAVRVAMWKDSGVEVPGLSKSDTTKLTDFVNKDPELKAFKDGLVIMGRQGKGWVEPTVNWDASTIIADLHNITEGAGRKKFLGQFIDNAEQMFGQWDNGKLVGPNINKIEAVYGTNVREALEDSLYRMTNGKNRSYGGDKETSMWSNWVNGSTGAIMFLNNRSALLQLIGSVNFLNFRDNNPYAAAKAFANQKQYWADFAHIWNSDKMKERRGGLKEDVAAAEIASAAAGSKNKVSSVVSYLLKVGYTPTMIADSFAIASGGAPFYRNRIKEYQSEYEGAPGQPLQRKYTDKEAEELAWLDFTKVSDETQQSGDPRDISKQQASGAGRLLLTFQNTAMQQSRIVKKAFLDLKNGRGDTKTNLSKIAYYVAVQNILFSGLQQGLFAVLFNNEDEETKKKTVNKKLIETADGVLDSVLRGTGFIGGIIATTKNVVEKYLEEEAKGNKADFAKPVLEFANISPPIGSKLKKAYSGLQESKYNADVIKERGFSMVQNGRVHLSPLYSVIGKEVEAFTNLPMDRLNNKIENVSQALNSQNETWQRVMVGLGWSPFSVGIKGSKEDLDIKTAAKQGRKEQGKVSAKEKRAATRDSIANLPEDEYKQYILKKKAERDARKDSIKNLPPEQKQKYLEDKAKSEELKKRQKEILKEAKQDSIDNLSPSEKANYNKKVAEEKALKRTERHEKYLEKKQALKDSLAGLSPIELQKYKDKKKAKRHEYYLEHKDEYSKRRKKKKKASEPEFS
jgi:hypothetical protein